MEKKTLHIDLGELCEAMENSSFENEYFLDLETGEILFISEYMDDEETEKLKDKIEEEFDRYEQIPKDESHDGYRDMQDFIATIENEHLVELLEVAINGKGAFRRFKDLLYHHPREQERWFTFENERTRRRVLDWFASQDIDAVLVEPTVQVDPGPPARTRLIAEVLAFVRAACKLTGVVRIALIGSLTTDEPEPKDADVLVTVTDDTDLEPLATLGRKLAGHAQGFGRGGDASCGVPASEANCFSALAFVRPLSPGIALRYHWAALS